MNTEKKKNLKKHGKEKEYTENEAFPKTKRQ
jgi:hypothetical protein